MVFEILVCLMCVAMVALFIILYVKYNKIIDVLVKVGQKVATLENTIRDVDESTGYELNRLSKEFESFRELYGDAAVEAEREAARAEKAFADGLSEIIGYGKQFQSRGE